MKISKIYQLVRREGSSFCEQKEAKKL